MSTKNNIDVSHLKDLSKFTKAAEDRYIKYQSIFLLRIL